MPPRAREATAADTHAPVQRTVLPPMRFDMETFTDLLRDSVLTNDYDAALKAYNNFHKAAEKREKDRERKEKAKADGVEPEAPRPTVTKDGWTTKKKAGKKGAATGAPPASDDAVPDFLPNPFVLDTFVNVSMNHDAHKATNRVMMRLAQRIGRILNNQADTPARLKNAADFISVLIMNPTSIAEGPLTQLQVLGAFALAPYIKPADDSVDDDYEPEPPQEGKHEVVDHSGDPNAGQPSSCFWCRNKFPVAEAERKSPAEAVDKDDDNEEVAPQRRRLRPMAAADSPAKTKPAAAATTTKAEKKTPASAMATATSKVPPDGFFGDSGEDDEEVKVATTLGKSPVSAATIAKLSSPPAAAATAKKVAVPAKVVAAAAAPTSIFGDDE